jgi:hypothetical protein
MGFVGTRYLHAAAVSFAVALPVAQLFHLLFRGLPGKVPFLSLVPVETGLTVVSVGMAAAVAMAVMVRMFDLPVATFWRRMVLMSMAPLVPCAFFSVRYEHAADPFAAWWSQALGLLLAILIGLQTGYQETTLEPVRLECEPDCEPSSADLAKAS